MTVLEEIINNKILKPVIINEKSNFVIITYWWGRGNLNANTQKPCRDELIIGQELIKQPIKFENMINNWVEYCNKANCNYLVQEYPEFAVPGGYQMAINAKPLFIKKALESCEGRAVVYIDGDMSVNYYPSIFDMKDVDYMARGWNIDPRANKHYLSKTKSICFDPFTFETSGGIMYFGNTINAFKLLDMWAKASDLEMFKGKADDRIISLIVSSKKLYIRMNILQLPIEYLWLTDIYEPTDKKEQYINKVHYDNKTIMFEHAACLTSEEKAREQGAAENRQPKFYNKIVEDFIECQTEGGIFYEHIIFENREQSLYWDRYLRYLSTAKLYKDDDGEIIHPYYIVKYKDFYGNKTDIAIDNISKTKNMIKILNELITEPIQYIKIMQDSSIHYTKGVLYTTDIIPTILALHYLKISVVYLPKNFNINLLRKVVSNIDKNDSEIVVGLSNDNENYPIFNEESPIFLCYKSRILNHLIKMSSNIDELNKNLKLCVLFVQLIRCNFLLTLSKSISKEKGVRSFDKTYKSFDKSIIRNSLSRSVIKSKNIKSLLSLDNVKITKTINTIPIEQKESPKTKQQSVEKTLNGGKKNKLNNKPKK